MLIPILSVALAVLAGLFVMMAMIASKRAGRIDSFDTELDQIRTRIHEAEAKSKDKARQIDELRARLNKAKDELKKAKKKAYEKSSGQKQTPEPSETSDEELEKKLLESRAQIKQLKEKLEQQKDHIQTVQEQADRHKSKLVEMKTKIDNMESEIIKVSRGETDKIVKLEKRTSELEKKLSIANRRLRTDAQVYRVTNSKLELAMEKISELEKRLSKAKKTTVAKKNDQC